MKTMKLNSYHIMILFNLLKCSMCNFADRWGYGNYRRRETAFPKTHKRFDNLSYFDA